MSLIVLSQAMGQPIEMVSEIWPNTYGERLAHNILDEINRRTGIEFRMVFRPANRTDFLLKNTERFNGTLAKIEGYDDSVPELIKVSEPIVVAPYCAYVTRPDLEIRDWSDLAPYRVAYMRGIKFVEEHLNQQHLPQISITNNVEEAFNLLLLDRIDIFISTPLTADDTLQSNQFANSGIRPISPALDSVSLYTYFRQDQEKIAKSYDNTLKAIKRDGTYEKILRQSRTKVTSYTLVKSGAANDALNCR